MADIVNLRLARKAAKRASDAREAAANRAKFGRTKAEKTRDRQSSDQLEQTLAGARRTVPEGD